MSWSRARGRRAQGGGREGAPPRRRGARGLTLIEAIISVTIVSVMLVAAVSTVASSSDSRTKISQRARGMLLAQDLMAEILEHAYQDPYAPGPLGPDAGEGGGTREHFDDIDDYHGWVGSPPQLPDGTPLVGWAGWTRSVTVEWVAANDLQSVQASETGVKRIMVVVSFGGVEVARLLAVRTGNGATGKQLLPGVERL